MMSPLFEHTGLQHYRPCSLISLRKGLKHSEITALNEKAVLLLSPKPALIYLPRSLHVDGDDVEAVAAELAGPAASLADPLQQAVLVRVAHGAVAPARVQQVTLETDEKGKGQG